MGVWWERAVYGELSRRTRKPVRAFTHQIQTQFLIEELRHTRLAKLDKPDGPYTALILAKSSMVRVGLGHRLTTDLSPSTFYYAVGQGALAVEIRSNDVEARGLCRALTNWPTQCRCLAERACLRILEGGCSVPVGVATFLETQADKPGQGVLSITGCVTSLTGEAHLQHTLTEEVKSPLEAEKVGERLAKVLIETGAREILDEITLDRQQRSGTDKTTQKVYM